MISRRALVGTVSVISAVATTAVAQPGGAAPLSAAQLEPAEHYAYIGAHRLHFRRHGAGEPMVLLPDFPNSSLSLSPLVAKLMGAASATEEAGVLGRIFAIEEDTLPALRRYEAARPPRGNLILEESRRQGKLFRDGPGKMQGTTLTTHRQRMDYDPATVAV